MLHQTYRVIVIDPPWPMKKIVRECRPNQVASLDYHTMTLDAIGALQLPCNPFCCHVFCWATQRFLPEAMELFRDKWKLRYRGLFVWHKPGGFQPCGSPQYNAEFALWGTKGTPSFRDTKAFPMCFSAARGTHSEKPEEFYAMIARVTDGPRLDMFARRKIEGFEPWGDEAPMLDEFEPPF